MRPLLQPDEVVQHQALATPGEDDRVNVWLVAFTNRRLFFIRTVRAPFKPKLENQGLEEVGRDRVHSATEMNHEITLHFGDGSSFVFYVPPRASGFSNQREFVRAAPRILSGAQVMTASAQVLG